MQNHSWVMTADNDAQRRVRRRDSAGVLLYRRSAGGLEVLPVHPSGWHNKKAPWSLPKGWPEGSETLEQAAVRETLEETGVAVQGTLTPLDFRHLQERQTRVRLLCGVPRRGAATLRVLGGRPGRIRPRQQRAASHPQRATSIPRPTRGASDGYRGACRH